jgi:two-component system alkaline phosphatase synthesis response regulator PhoP
MAKILVLDDEKMTIDIIVTYLGMIGHEAITATSGRQFWERLERETPDGFLLDIMLPDDNGLLICRQLREQPQFAALPIIMISAYFPPLNTEAGEAGANGYLGKPIRMDRLRDLLSDAGIPVGSPYKSALH